MISEEKRADIVPAAAAPGGAEVARTDRSNRNKLHVKIAGRFLRLDALSRLDTLPND